MSKIHKICFIIFIAVFGGLNIIFAETKTVVNYLTHLDQKLETDYCMSRIDMDTSSRFMKSIKPILDTLADSYLDSIYLWTFWSSNDTVISSIIDWDFGLLGHRVSLPTFVGLYTYVKDGKPTYFALYKNDKEDSIGNGMRDIMKPIEDSMKIVFNNFRLPPFTYYLSPPSSKVVIWHDDKETNILNFFYHGKKIQKFDLNVK